MPVRVSVVVPVFKPGLGFDELMESFDRQSLGPDDLEVLLCDDGSGSPTRERLEQIARARPHVRVLTLPHTGWPGTPRNHGIEAARGEYVFFADQDDRLFDDALEQLCDYADRHASDVVIGREVGVGRRIPRGIFRRDIPHAVLGKDPILELLTPHKLFRTSFLRSHGIRFPDGRVRLEDHLFVMQAYFRARTISVLASQPCYAWVKHPGSASASRIDPVTYFPHLEAVLDLVEANTEPGTLRDTLLRHWYRGKILGRLGGRRMLRYPADYRDLFLDVVIPIAQRRFTPAVEAGLAFPLRIRSALLRAGEREGLLHLAEFDAELDCRAEVTSARWTRAGKLELTVEVRVLREDRDALIFDVPETNAESSAGAGRERTSRPAIWRAPAGISDNLPSPDVLDATRDLRRDRVEVLVRDVDGSERRIQARPAQTRLPAVLTLDPLRFFGRSDISTGGQLVTQVRHAGWSFDVPLRAEHTVLDGLGASPFLAGRTCRVVAGEDGSVQLRREWPGGRLRDLAARAIRRALGSVRQALHRR
ncbi:MULTISPECIES: glycosyltransferase family A protein [unclassified Microbacterium]|uniref:glycosyltransferase family 2 protein n=1 Tax=unclassified Microbacterium TaxID=2609290 RepID=UPI00214AAB2F|nr:MULTISPECIES: glycosyltransferase family A protein [unclassified Microbacterium]MCR2810594.1 glycosyltransferase family 2 protein [Microbacterium sp. zg.B185]WIM18132.1 glycosyltransferase family A protein [Microbacterium sp. zg-B185]